jgi:hypothetical protein
MASPKPASCRKAPRQFRAAAWLRTAGRGVLAAALLCARSFGAETAPQAGPAPADSGEASATASQIAAWAAELDDNRYMVREAAQQKLREAGAAALQAVEQAARAGSLESSTRALNVLLEWSEDAEGNLPLALQALEQLANLEDRPLESAYAAQKLAGIREREAIAELERLGGRVVIDQQLAGVNRLAALEIDQPPLQVILGPEWKGGTAGLQQVAKMPRATTLSLHSAPLGDDAAEELAKLAHVRRLEIYGTPLSDGAVQQLTAALAATEVDLRRGGARLGIRGMPIQEIVPHSAAAKAGLERGDVITQLGDTPIRDFEHLTEQIANFRPGDEVAVTVVRQGNAMVRTVAFDRWGQEDAPPEPPPGTPRRERPPGAIPPVPVPR